MKWALLGFVALWTAGGAAVFITAYSLGFHAGQAEAQEQGQ